MTLRTRDQVFIVKPIQRIPIVALPRTGYLPLSFASRKAGQDNKADASSTLSIFGSTLTGLLAI